MHFFPFNVTGPQFLAVYAVLCMLVAVGLAAAYRIRQPFDDGSPIRLTDPYAIAVLRGGPVEAVRVAMVSLTHRGHLSFESGYLGASDAGAAPDQPLERAILGHFRIPATDSPDEVYASPQVKPHAHAIRDDLVANGLLSDPLQPGTNPCFIPAAAALATLIGVAALRIWWSGPPYVFLLMMSCLASVAVLASYLRRSTPRSRHALRHLTTLFAGNRARLGEVKPGEQAREVALLAAVFGVGALAVAGLPWVDHLRPGVSSTSSGCGSDASDGGSSGDSGGGCGGGGD